MAAPDDRRRVTTPPKTGAKSFAGHALGALVFLTVFHLIDSQAWNLQSFLHTAGRVVGIIWLVHYLGFGLHRLICSSTEVQHDEVSAGPIYEHWTGLERGFIPSPQHRTPPRRWPSPALGYPT